MSDHPLMKTLDWSVETLGQCNSTGLCIHLFIKTRVVNENMTNVHAYWHKI
jgi:hypothetical protein